MGFPTHWCGLLLFFVVWPSLRFSTIHISSPSHPLVSLFASLFFSDPSSHPPPSSLFQFLSPLRMPSHAFISTSSLISPPPYLLLLTPCSHPAHCYAVYPCITVTTLPAPAVKLFLGELTCERRAVLRRKEKSAERVMEKQDPPPLTAGSDQILCFV